MTPNICLKAMTWTQLIIVIEDVSVNIYRRIQRNISDHVYTVSNADPFVSSLLCGRFSLPLSTSVSLSIHFFFPNVYIKYGFSIPSFPHLSLHPPSKPTILKLMVLKTRILCPYGQWIFAGIFLIVFLIIIFDELLNSHWRMIERKDN